jgi:hypothetical protein
MVHQFCTAPTLFDQIELWVDFREKKSGKPMFSAAHFKRRFDSGEIGLVEKESAATAVNAIIGTLGVPALCVEASLLEKSSLH